MSSLPSTSEYPGHSLLETMMVDALERTVDEASGRVRLTLNVSHFATRALFAGTDDVPNAELMRIIRGEAKKVARGDTREVRHFRYSVGQDGRVKPERTLKIDRIRQIAIGLMTSGTVSKADAVRAWSYALIQESARVAVAELRAELRCNISMPIVMADPIRANRFLNRCYAVLVDKRHKYFEKSTEALRQERPLAEESRFLDYATMEVIEAMFKPVSPWHAIRDLLYNVYPEIDKYEFGLTEDT